MHKALFYPSDYSLAKSLSYGKFCTHLTSSDVATNRRLRGSCPQCQAGKYRHPPKPSSTTPPAQSSGEVISFDPNKLPVPSVGGYTHFILCTDEKSGFLSVIGCLSKSMLHVFQAFRVYNAHQHRVLKLHGDCKSINLSFIPHLGSIGVSLVSFPPADHA
jgi:hypothetical protein